MAYLRNFISSTNLSDNSGQFKTIKKTFTQQFSQIYYARLQALRPVILKNLSATENSPQIGRVLDVEEGKMSYIVGTVFCENIDRPNVFDEVENNLISNYRIDKSKKITQKTPIVFLEDESGRIELDISFVSEYLWVTGTTIGLRGSADSLGKFHVDKIIEPGIPNIISSKPKASQDTDHYVAIVSGLHYGRDSAELSLERSQLIDFLGGYLHPEFGMKIAKLIIAGNSMSAPIKIANEFKKKYGHEIAKYKMDHLYQMDREFSNLSRSISIEIMPGDEDLSNLSFPQNPVPKSLFPSISKLATVNFTTNPSLIDIESIKFLGTSGQNIDDIFRHVNTEDRLLLAEKTLSWRNIAPTAPDSLYCYPFYEKDPFVLNDSPNVYFVGNQPYFGTKKIQVNGGYITIVLVPDFFETKTIVLININDLSAIPLKLDN